METMNREWPMAQLAKLRSLLDARQPAHSLPQGFYVDPDVFATAIRAA